MSRRPARTVALVGAAAVLATVAMPVASASAAADRTAPTMTLNVKQDLLTLPKVGFGRIRINVRAKDAVGVERVIVGLFDQEGRYPQGLAYPMELKSGTAKDGRWTMRFGLDHVEPVGNWSVYAYAMDAAGNYSSVDKRYDRFAVKYGTKIFGFNAGPEPVAQGAPLTVKGRLVRTGVELGWLGAGNRKLSVEFRKAGTSGYKSVATVTTARDGSFSLTRKATASGSWRVRFAGTSTTAPVLSSADAVAVTAPAS